MKPDIAKELTDAHATEKSAYNKTELEILTKVNKFKSLYPELQSPAADHASGTSRAKRDNFKKDWANQVAPVYSEEVQLFELRGLVPEQVRVDVEKFATTAEFWEVMDVEFGNKNELV